VPLLAILAGPKAAVVGTAMVSVVISVRMIVHDHHSIARRTVALLLAGSVVGAPIGLYVLAEANRRLLQALIGLLVLAFAVLLWRGFTLASSGNSSDVAAGFAAGVLSTSTGTSGPPLVIVLHARALEPRAFRGTLAAVFLVQGAVALIAFALADQITDAAWRVLLAGLPGLVVGVLAGDALFARVDREPFRRLVLAMLVVSALLAIGAAVTG
jgi:uncharacterized protein